MLSPHRRIIITATETALVTGTGNGTFCRELLHGEQSQWARIEMLASAQRDHMRLRSAALHALLQVDREDQNHRKHLYGGLFRRNAPHLRLHSCKYHLTKLFALKSSASTSALNLSWEHLGRPSTFDAPAMVSLPDMEKKLLLRQAFCLIVVDKGRRRVCQSASECFYLSFSVQMVNQKVQ